MTDKYEGKHRSGETKKGPNGWYEGRHTAAYFDRLESADETAQFFNELGLAKDQAA